MKHNCCLFTFILLVIPLGVLAQPERKAEYGGEAVLWEGTHFWKYTGPRWAHDPGGEIPDMTSIIGAPGFSHDELWPGKSITINQITVTWTSTAEAAQTGGTRGNLDFQGPRTHFQILDVPAPSGIPIQYAIHDKNQEIYKPAKNACVYLDDTVLFFYWKRVNDQECLGIAAREQPRGLRFVSPAYNGLILFISQACPLTLNQYSLRIADDPVISPEGKKEYSLIVQGCEEGNVTIPLHDMEMERFGRFSMDVQMDESVFEKTKTMMLVVDVRPDLNVRGADAYLQHFEIPALYTYAKILDQLLNHYADFLGQLHIKVHWDSLPQYPESAEYAQNLRTRQGYKIPDDFEELRNQYSYQTVRRSLECLFQEESRDHPEKRLVLEWPDDFNLRIYPQGYEIVAKEIEQAKDAFLQRRPVVTKVYQSQNMQAETARALIGKEIKSYALVYNPGAEENERFQLQENGPAAGANVIAHLEEFAVADPRTNSVIVSALEATHERVSALLREMDQMVQPPKSTVPPTAYRLEVILFECAKAPADAPRRSAWLNPETPPGPEIRAALDHRFEGPVNARDVDIQELLSLITGQTKLQCQIDPEIHAKVTFATQNPTVRELLDQILPAQGLGYRVVDGQTLRIERKSGSEPPDIQTALDKKLEGPYIARNQELQTLVTLLSSQSGLQFVLGKGLNLPVSFSMDNPSVRQILDAVLTANGLEYKIKDGIVVIQAAGMDSTPRTLLYDPAELQKYGITPEDLELFGFNAVAERGKGMVSLIGEKSETGQVVVSLSENYTCQLQYVDYREPYLILKGSLTDAASNKTLLENTLYLESGKPSLLGITNLNQALILVLRRH